MSVVNQLLNLQKSINEYALLSSEELDERIAAAKSKLEDRLVILGHHYQRDDVIQYADHRGDSLQLARIAAVLKDTEYIVFCGVHFMAETTDILTSDRQTVILPDMNAGCSMADMADDQEVEECWEFVTKRFGDSIIPVTYVNSTAAIKAFVGKHGGLTITSSNAEKVFAHALQAKQRILFLPDQHLGRNTGVKFGIPLNEMCVYDPKEMEIEYPHGEGDPRIILWKGHCSVHMKFEPRHVHEVRSKYPGIRVLVHPECMYETVQLADEHGSTDFIIKTVRKAPAGTKWAIGTEHNLVNRLAQEHPEQLIVSLNEMVCPCLTMNRIDRPHLLWSLENLLAGSPRNVIRVDSATTEWARVAIDRMLHIS
ncbi:quinolinate synthase NadA [Effusibacillus lacus]|uniref:Quinolinate synthase n=1 Tax=Effusibacillus lacus TaxID=1348429 RepID=A0A292YME9_9BACL|nr:quinolinate synthase NadA [Effusibacillus lacus]TCS72071.1 quinolinate synthetase [Effusibacillus lacus]GAX90356.1 quinolinate synthetase [Effusibacillus lacus]